MTFVTDYPAGPTLDRSGEVWIGSLPGLGSIAVGPDGAVDVTAETGGSEDPYLRAQALRYGWAEGLSFVRRGYLIASGAAACPGTSSPSCVLFSGDPHDVAIVLAELVRRHGWAVMGDRFTPVRWQGDDLVAVGREAPVLIARRRVDTVSMAARRVRDNCDSRAVDIPRHRAPAVVAAAVTISARRPQEEVLAVLSGRQRFEAGAGIVIGGVFAHQDHAPPSEPSHSMQQHLRLSAIPQARLRIDTKEPSPAVDLVLGWLTDTGYV